MRESELDYFYVLRRRRLVGLCALVGLVLAGLAMNDWRITPIWSVFEVDEGAFAAGDPYGEWIYAVCDGETQQITVLKDGALSGADGLRSLVTARFPNRCDLPNVDNPDLAEWQAKLRTLQDMTSSDASAREILNAAREMPMTALYLKEVRDWVRAEPANAAAFLDAVAAEPMRFDHPVRAIATARRNYFSDLVDVALDSALAAQDAPAHLESWLGENQIAADGERLEKLARMDGLTDKGRIAILERIDALPYRARADAYLAAAGPLTSNAAHAGLLARQLGDVPRDERSRIVAGLLSRGDANVQFPIALLSDFRRVLGGANPDSEMLTFISIANALRNEDEAPLLLTRHLRDLDDIQRRMAATHLLTLDRDGEVAFALGVLRALPDLHRMSRPKVIYAVIQSEQFGEQSVQEACLLAIKLEMRGPEQQELLSAMLQHRDLSKDLQSRIRAELG